MKVRKPTQSLAMKKILYQSIYDLSFPIGYSLTEVGTSQSLLQNCLKCPMCYLLGLNRFSKYDRYNTTGFGSMFHDALDHAYSWAKYRHSPPVIGQVQRWLESFPIRFPEDMKGKTQEEIVRDQQVALLLFRKYLEVYETDFTTFQFIEVEKVSSCYFGKYLLRRKSDGKFLAKDGSKIIMEHKTKSRIGEENLTRQLTFDFQNLFYLTCEEIEQPGSSVDGVLYNIIRNTYPKKRESLEEFLERLSASIESDPAYHFVRYTIPYNRNDKKQFIDELSEILHVADELITGKRKVYKNTSACIGAYTCDYLDACSSGRLTGYLQQEHLFPELHLGV